MKRLGMFFAFTLVVSAFQLGGASIAAHAETGPTITFEPSTYSPGSSNAQDGWSATGPYDQAVVANSVLATAPGSFGTQSFRMSNAVTSGSFGDQVFSRSLSDEAGETTAVNGGLSGGTRQPRFEATFDIASTQPGSVQPGLYLSVSPDRGDGARMSYLRFEDQTDGIHVFFVDVTGVNSPVSFDEYDIAMLDRSVPHAITFSMDFVDGPSNDIVRIYIDGALAHTGTSWENYFLYDAEAAPNVGSRTVDSLLFRAGGNGTTDNATASAGLGFLFDNLTLTSGQCLSTGFVRGINLTAKQIGGDVTGTLDATGCNIGVYYDSTTSTGDVTGADIHGANYFGVVVNGTSVDITDSSVHNIGEVPFNGAQHGNAVVYVGGASGIINNTTVFLYQKNGITARDAGTSVILTDNTVTGEGSIAYIAQNGIQISFGATAMLTGNEVKWNDYSPPKVTACGLLIYKAGGVGASKTGLKFVKAENNFHDNETNICNFGKGGGFSS